MKTFLIYCLVILLMSLSVGIWIVSVPMVNLLKRRASGEMRHPSNQLCLWLRPDVFRRVGGDEIMVEGQLYDVISEQEQGDWIKFLVYRDDLESYFLDYLLVDLGAVDSSGDDSSPLTKIIKNILHLEFYLTPRCWFNITVPYVRMRAVAGFLAVIPSSPTIKVPLPPPRIL